MKHYIETGEPVNPDTWRFFEKYEPIIEEMQKYAFDNHEEIEIRINGSYNGDRQTWLNREYNVGDREMKDDIVLFESGRALAHQYEWR